MDNFDSILARASQAITSPYFLLPIYRGAPVHRERVYCYELYHQIRQRWPEDCSYIINGELDKSAHVHFQLGRNGPKPDFLIHVPGDDINYLIMEVKSGNSLNAKGLSKDIATLTKFLTEYRYTRAIYLLFGEPGPRMMSSIRASLNNTGIELWLHSAAGEAAERHAI